MKKSKKYFPKGRRRVLRYLVPAEEDRLRKVIRGRFSHHQPHLAIVLNRGMPKGKQYRLTFADGDIPSRTVMANNVKHEAAGMIDMVLPMVQFDEPMNTLVFAWALVVSSATPQVYSH